MNFEQTLKQVQEQLQKDKQTFKATGKMSDLLIRVENYNRGRLDVKLSRA